MKKYDACIEFVRLYGWFGWMAVLDEKGNADDEFTTGYRDCKKTIADKLRQTAKKLGWDCVHEIGKAERKAKQ